MANGRDLPIKKDKKVFSATADRVHKINNAMPRRGGFRL